MKTVQIKLICVIILLVTIFTHYYFNDGNIIHDINIFIFLLSGISLLILITGFYKLVIRFIVLKFIIVALLFIIVYVYGIGIIHFGDNVLDSIYQKLPISENKKISMVTGNDIFSIFDNVQDSDFEDQKTSLPELVDKIYYPNKYGIYITHIGGEGTRNRTTEIMGMDERESFYMKEPEYLVKDWAPAYMNNGGYMIGQGCKDGYEVVYCGSSNSDNSASKEGNNCYIYVNEIKTTATVECEKKI